MVEPKIAQGDSASQRHAEGLDRTIKILVMDGIFIMPNSGGGIRHLIDHVCAAIDARLGLDRRTGRANPRTGCGAHADSDANGGKGETRRAGDIVPAVGGIVVHVALPGIGLAPGVLLQKIVLHFGVIGRAYIHRRDQISLFNQNSVRCARMSMAGVVLRAGAHGKGTSKWIYPRSRAQRATIGVTLKRVLTRAVRIRASRT